MDTPTHLLRSQRPPFIAASACATLRASAHSSAMPCSAAATVLAVGAAGGREAGGQAAREAQRQARQAGHEGRSGRRRRPQARCPSHRHAARAWRSGRTVDHEAAGLRGGGQVDVVDAHAGAAHHLEAAL